MAKMNPITQGIEKTEAFLVLGIGDEAWEDLPTERSANIRCWWPMGLSI